MEAKQSKIDQTLVHHAMREKEGTFQSSFSSPLSRSTDSLFGELANWSVAREGKETRYETYNK